MPTNIIWEASMTWNSQVGKLSVSIEYDQGAQWPVVEWPVTVQAELIFGTYLAEFALLVPYHGDLAFSPQDDVTPLTRCLIRCCLGLIVDCVLECRTSDAGVFIDCMKQQRSSVEADLVACALKCFART